MQDRKKVFSETDRLRDILRILQPDGLLFWRLKPRLKVIFQNVSVSINSKGLRGEEFSGKKVEGTFRIICLGASPTFGWGVPSEETYPRQLERMLRKEFSPKRFEVINAGVPGYTSFQGLNFLKKKVLKYSPDLLTISYVINDVDRHRFYRSDGRSDKGLLPLSSVTIAIQNMLFKSKLYQSLMGTFSSLMEEREGFSGKPGDLHIAEVRVSREDYRNNLEEMNKVAGHNNIRVLFLKMPVNLPWPPRLSASVEKDLDRHISRGIEDIKSRLYPRAIGEFKRAILLNPYYSVAYFYLGSCYEAEGEHKKAKEALLQAKKYDAFRCRKDSLTYNRIMEKVADKNRTPLVDIVLAFANQKEKQLFVEPVLDPIHPNAPGHRIIAQEVYKTLIAKGIV